MRKNWGAVIFWAASVIVILVGCNDHHLKGEEKPPETPGETPVPDLEPPVAVIESATTSALILETASFDGTASYDPDNEGLDAIVDYQWSIQTVPAGSAASLEIPSNNPDLSSLFIDVAGAYTIQLIVVDQDGLDSEPALFTFDGIPVPDTQFLYSATWDGRLPTHSVNGSGDLTYIDSDDHGDWGDGSSPEAVGVWGDGNFIYLANVTEGLPSYSVDSSGKLTHIDSDDQGGEALDVWGDGNFIYLANGTAGLHTYSVDGSGNLTPIDFHDLCDGPEHICGKASGVWGDGNFIYLANSYGGLHTYSVDGSGNLTHLGSLDQGGQALGVWGDGNFVYLAGGHWGLDSYSVDGSGNLTHIDTDDPLGSPNPSTAKLPGGCLEGDAYGVWGDGNFLYLANGLGGLRTYSVDGSGNLTHIDTDDPGGNASAYDVWGDENFIYVANGLGGLQTYSVDGSGNLTYLNSNDQGVVGQSVAPFAPSVMGVWAGPVTPTPTP